MRGLHFELPIYYLILFIVLSFFLSWLLYINKKIPERSSISYRILFALRFLFLMLISFFLMKPKIQKTKIQKEKPILVFAQDVSESIIANKTSRFDVNLYSDSIKNFLSKLSDSYEIRTLIFGNKSMESDSFVFNHNQSNLGQLFTQVEEQFNTTNLTDLILASDGIINTGNANPTFENAKVLKQATRDYF